MVKLRRMKNEKATPYKLAIIDLFDAYHYADAFEDWRYAWLTGGHAPITIIDKAKGLADRLFKALNPTATTQPEWYEWDAGYDVWVFGNNDEVIYKAHTLLPDGPEVSARDSMLITPRLKKALRFATKTHEIYQKQKRKGKDIPYITHPLTVGLILARAGANEDVVIAGILHDTIEDSPSEKKVTKEMLAERFGENVAVLVDSVTEQDKSLSWEERKHAALAHITAFSNDMLLVKSADILANALEMIEDHNDYGDTVFDRFNASKDKILGHYVQAIETIVDKWPDSPLAADLREVKTSLASAVG